MAGPADTAAGVWKGMTVRDVCFLSDYGYRDDFAGVCRAVIRQLAPGVVVVDVTHGVPPHDVTAGAVVLRNTLPYMPDLAVHLAVVDPGVGGSRRAVAVRSSGGRLFVGPDNGLLLPAAEADGGPEEAVELTESSLWLEPVSRTFHGRDIFAPVAAALASGTALPAVGSPLPVWLSPLAAGFRARSSTSPRSSVNVRISKPSRRLILSSSTRSSSTSPFKTASPMKNRTAVWAIAFRTSPIAHW